MDALQLIYFINMKNIAVNKTVQVFMVLFFLFTIKLNAQSDLLYGGGRINSLDTKEQKKIKRGQLYKNDVWNKNAVDSLYDKFISNSKK